GPQANHDGESRTWEVQTPTRRVPSPWWGWGRLNGWGAKRKGVPRNVWVLWSGGPRHGQEATGGNPSTAVRQHRNAASLSPNMVSMAVT
ncbi:MAG: hypothetical protein ACYDEY_15420, partial [Acidimicrobiales bacterium]